MPATPFIGQVIPVPYNFAPQGWALCNGQILSIAQNTALFSLLGTAFGGDGKTTFGLPNLQGRVAIDAGQGTGLSNYNPGATGGADSVTLTLNQLAAHSAWCARLRPRRRQQVAGGSGLGQAGDRYTLRRVGAAGRDVRGVDLGRRQRPTS